MTATAASRLAWADLAKGVCIVLVVLWHVTVKDYATLDWATPYVIESVWVRLSVALQPIRMPLFFLLSGFFAATSLHRAWPRVARPRILRPYYLYVVWLVIQTAFFAIGPYLPLYRAEDLGDLASDLVFGTGDLWYLYALVAYFLVARSLAPWSPVVPMVFAMLLALATGVGWVHLPDNGDPLLRNLVFFVFGCCLPGIVSAVAAAASVRRMLVLGAAYGAAGVIGIGLHVGLVEPMVSPLGVAFGITAAVIGARSRLIVDPLTWIGRRTLSIYVLHLPVLAITHWVALRFSAHAWWQQPALSLVYPLLITGWLIAACLAIEALLVRAGGWWLFQLPPARSGVGMGDSHPAPEAAHRAKSPVS
jgi:uncharacterized membrane protein YcfT